MRTTTAQPMVPARLLLAAGAPASFLVLADTTVFVLALRVIQKDLHASPAALQLVVIGYQVTFAGLVLSAGRLGDQWGHRRTVLAGLGCFALAATLAALSPSVTALIGARILQGAAAALIVPQISALVRVLVPEDERQSAFGALGAVGASAGVASPLLGGLLIAANVFGLGWRAVPVIEIVGCLVVAAV